MEVFIEKTQTKKNMNAKTIKELLLKLKINSENVLTIKNDELVTEDEKISETDKIKILSVISGG